MSRRTYIHYPMILAPIVAVMLIFSIGRSQTATAFTTSSSPDVSSANTLPEVTASAATLSQPLPEFKQVEEVVRRHFAIEKDYRSGDLLCQSEVSPLYKQLKLLGWNDGGFKAILARVPADNAFLVRTLRTDRGKKFMRKVASYPMAYDRLDRLSRIPSGQKLLKDLVRTKGGYQMIEYMTTSQGGTNLGKELSRVPGGADFNKSTGEIYTEMQLVEALHKLYEESAVVPKAGI